MKKILSVLLCIITVVGTISITAHASEIRTSEREEGSFRERWEQRERRFNLADHIDYSKYPTLANIKEVRDVNKELRQDNKELRKELLNTLKEAEEEGLTFSDETKLKIEKAKAALKDAKDNADFERGSFRNKVERGTLRAKWSDKDFDEEALKEKAISLLEKLNTFNEKLQERNSQLQELIEKVEEEIQVQTIN